jgi:hypothetical protein
LKGWHLCLQASVLLAFGCHLPAELGSLRCARPSDCAPPDTVCGPDGRCVPGCGVDGNRCLNGALCDSATGQCVGAPACVDADHDDDCDPPAGVCDPNLHACVAGCTLVACANGLRCDPTTGRCCDPADPTCPLTLANSPMCNIDSECPSAPAVICSGGLCVPGCDTTGCAAPLSCNSASGHCETPGCQRDADCDAGSYCAADARCTVLPFAGAIPCAGGTPLSYRCAIRPTPAELVACAGPPGPAGCPYCLGGSCLQPGLCASTATCHAGDSCKGGLCRVDAPECPSLVSVASVFEGRFAAGKQVCVRDKVESVRTGYDGMIELQLGSATSFVYADLMPMYGQAGVRVPTAGETVTVHGAVRWDAGHQDRELLPVDWVSEP